MKAGEAQLFNHLDKGDPWPVDVTIDKTRAGDYDAVRGRTLTSWPSLRTDIRNAGGTWVDREVVVDDNGPNVIVSSRKPDDLPALCRTFTEQFARQTAGAR